MRRFSPPVMTDQRHFSRTARRVKSINLGVISYRGGIRL